MKNNSSAYDYMVMNKEKIIKLNRYLKKLNLNFLCVIEKDTIKIIIFKEEL